MLFDLLIYRNYSQYKIVTYFPVLFVPLDDLYIVPDDFSRVYGHAGICRVRYIHPWSHLGYTDKNVLGD